MLPRASRRRTPLLGRGPATRAVAGGPRGARDRRHSYRIVLRTSMSRWLFPCLIAACSCSSSTSGAGATDDHRASQPPPAPFTCALGSLMGSWRIVYVESDGTCGRVADEVATVPTEDAPDAGASADAGVAACTYAARAISADKCSIDLDFTCPLNGLMGTQHWSGTLHQTSATTLGGSLGLQVSGATSGPCRSTYSVRWIKL